MQSINEESTELVTAEELRDLTITKEELFERDRINVLESLISSMVKQATDRGVMVYEASLNPSFDPVLLQEIKTELTGLGYTLDSKKVKNETVGEHELLSISWAEQAAADIPTESPAEQS